MGVMYLGWKLWKRTKIVKLQEMDLETDVYAVRAEDVVERREKGWRAKVSRVLQWIL